MTFYTYLYIRTDGTPYYVGKGQGKRCLSRQHSVFVPLPSRIFVQYWSSEAEALSMEKWWITLFGRQDLGTGILRNHSDGGEQPVNLSPEAKQRQRTGFTAWQGSTEQRQHLVALLTTEHQSAAGKKGGNKHSEKQQAHSRKIAAQASLVGKHVRWHVKRGIIASTCLFCNELSGPEIGDISFDYGWNT